jgi:UDP:flavonoid glycosyltransferase YjiC (YdhE family)
MEPRWFLFVMWEGGGNVPLQLGLARKLLARGHQVRVLTEPSLRQDVLATGASFSSFTNAPHRQDRSRQSDLVRDFDARTPIGALAATRDRVMFGPARAYAQDTLTEIQRLRPHVLAVDWVLAGAAVAGEAAAVPTAVLLHGNNLLPEPGKPAPGFGFLPARSALGRARDRVLTRAFLRLFDRGLPALNNARLAFGLRPLGHVLEQLERPARLLCLYPAAFDLPAGRHPAALRYVGPVGQNGRRLCRRAALQLHRRARRLADDLRGNASADGRLLRRLGGGGVRGGGAPRAGRRA